MLDQVFAFYSRFDVTGKFTEDYNEIDKMIKSFSNNYPTMKPFFISDSEKRQAIRSLDTYKPRGMTWKEVPIIGMNKNVPKLFDLSLAKIGVGFYYLSTSNIAPINSKIVIITERDILLKQPQQLSVFNLKYRQFLSIKNPNKKAQEQLGVLTSYNHKEKLFCTHLRLNQAIVSTVAILSPDDERLDSDYRILPEGFPWGVDTEKLLIGNVDDTYYNENKSLG